MSLRMLRYGALAAALLAGALPARADLQVQDGNKAIQTLCTTTFGTPSKQAYCHYLVDVNGVAFGTLANPFHTGLTFGGVDLLLGQATAAKSLPVALPFDILNAAATITAADGASATISGQNGVSIVTGTPTAGSVYSYAVNGQSEAVFTIGNTFVGTLQFEASANGGQTWTPRWAHVMGTKSKQTQVTGPGVFHVNGAAITNVRVRALTLTSGTPSIQLNSTIANGSVYVLNDFEQVDNTTGLSPTVKQAGTATASDNALTVQNPNEAAALQLMNTALGACTEAAYTGTGTPTLCSVLKGMFGQAPASGAAGTAPPAGANIAYVQVVPGAQPQPILPTPTEGHLGQVGGDTVVFPASFTRPANTTAYAVGQVVANSPTAALVAPLSFTLARKAAGTGRITRARLSSSNPAAVGVSFRLHLFKLAPTTTAGDGASISGAVNGVTAIKIGQFDFTMDSLAWSDGAKAIAAPATGAYIAFDAGVGSQNVYGLLEARSAYTPASGETFTVALEADRD